MASERIQRRIELLLDEADQAVSQFDWESVLQRAQAVLRLEPGNQDALAYLAAAERDSGILLSASDHQIALASTDQPSSFANGRYQVKRFLGEGGKKKVYLAQDTLLDREGISSINRGKGAKQLAKTRPGSVPWPALQ